MSLKSGVSYYTVGTLQAEIPFPEGKVCCQYCPLLRFEEAYRRYSCRLTGEWLLYPFGKLGNDCPIEIKEETDE